MPIDWTKVTVDHVRQACDLYDADAASPSRAAKSTLLLLNGRSYPAKFIRGLAYRIATGIELDPNKDFTGGDETARFFAALGLITSKGAAPPVPTSMPAAPPPPVPTAATTPTPRKYEPQKQALLDLLRK